MNKPNIRSYDELLAEKERLKVLFSSQQEFIKREITSIKESFNPLKVVAQKIGKFTSSDKSLGLFNVGLSFLVDLVLRKLILKKSGWLVRLAAPFLLKNVLSHFAANKIKTQMPDIGKIIRGLAKYD